MSVAGMMAYDGMLRQYGGKLGKYYDVPSLEEFKKSNARAQPKLKAGYTRSSARMEGEGVGEMVYSQNPRRVRTFKGKDGSDKYGMTSGTYIYKAPKAAAPAPAKAPPPKPKPKPEAPPLPVQLSRRAAGANAYTDAYEKIMLPRQGDYVIKDDQSVAQDFKNKYEANLTNELREKDPGSLEAIAEDIKQKDAYALNLGTGLSLV